MHYKIIPLEERINPWYILQEIYARMFRDELIETSPEPDTTRFKLDLYYDDYPELLGSLKSGFFEGLDIMNIACEPTENGRGLYVYRPTSQNLLLDKRDFDILSPSQKGEKVFTFYPNVEWVKISDISKRRTYIVGMETEDMSPYAKKFDDLMRNFTEEKNIVLIRKHPRFQKQI